MCLVVNPAGNRPLGRPRRRWVVNIKMVLGEIGRGDMDCMGPAQDRDQWKATVNAAMNLRVSENVGKLWSGYTTSFSILLKCFIFRNVLYLYMIFNYLFLNCHDLVPAFVC
jgi:hypothetical protein